MHIMELAYLLILRVLHNNENRVVVKKHITIQFPEKIIVLGFIIKFEGFEGVKKNKFFMNYER